MLTEIYEQFSPYYSGPNHVFLQRSGSLDSLPAVEQVTMTDAGRSALIEFENQLFTTEIDSNTIGEVLAKDTGQDVHALRFCYDYFQENSGELQTFAEQNALEPPTAYDQVSLAGWFYKASFTLDGDVFRPLAQRSINHVTDKLVEPIMQGDVEAVQDITDHVSVVINPQNFVSLSEQITAVRKNIFGQWRATRKAIQFHAQQAQVDQPYIDELSGKLTILDIYLAKTNSKLAELRALAAYMVDARTAVTDKEHETLFGRLEAVLPNKGKGYNNPELRQRRFARLDAIRNGLSFVRDETGAVIATEVVDSKLYAEQADENRYGELPAFTPEQTKLLKEFIVTPEEMKEIVSQVIYRAGLLSADQTPYTPGESTPATDGAWRVAISPLKATFSVQRSPRVYMVSNQPRSLYDLLIVGGAHEMRHIDQERASIALAGKLAIANVGGKRMSALTEGDANTIQQQAEQELFGEIKDGIRITFADALRVLQAEPKALAKASLAFYQALGRYGAVNEASARTAVDRVFRLARYGQDSQPLSYAEGGRMGQITGFFVSDMPITTFDLPDQHRLHRFGLLEPTDQGQGLIPWYQIMLEVAQPYLQRALAQDNR